MGWSIGSIAGLLAAVAFLILVGLLAIPLTKLGRVLDEATKSIQEITENTIPILSEASKTVGQTNNQLEKLDVITSSTAEVTQNVSALSSLVAATVGTPLIKLASFSYGVRTAMSRKKDGQ